MTQNIYFDESGFTGNNLLHPDQRFFAYASVATDDDEARAFVERLSATYGIQGGELKGSKLTKFSRGRRAIDDIFLHFGHRLKVSISNKKFALACKLHEYIFEPCFSSISSIFYHVGFHHFIANMLYLGFAARSVGVDEIFTEFEEFMRSGERTSDAIFPTSALIETSSIMTQIREFAQYQAPHIRAELAALDDSGVTKWILDLTNTALFTLLANWGLEYDEITAVCDPSKPLQHEYDVFTAMIGRTDRIFTDAFGQPHPISFNLSGPIQFPDSKITHGIQIADAVAAAAVYALSNTNDEHATRWREVVAKIGHYGSVLPNFDEVNPKSLRAQRNAVLLMELHSRAKSGQSIVEGMPEFVNLISQRLVTEPIDG